MPTNFNIRSNVKSEQSLYENLVIESLKIYGQDVYYLPRTVVNENRVFGEDIPSTFDDAYKIEMYIDNIEGFDGEGDLFTKFGVEIRDEATFIVSRRRWRDTVKRYDNEISGDRPREGDLVYLPMSKTMFEIRHVEHEQPFYQLANVPVFRLRATTFEYSDEDLDTGVEAIDNIEKDYAYTYNLTLNNNSNFITTGMSASQILDSSTNPATIISGEVSGFNNDTKVLSLVHVGTNDGKYHTWNTARHITVSGLNKSDSDFGISALATDNKISQDEQNTDFSTLTDFLDFTENNPFGDPENN